MKKLVMLCMLPGALLGALLILACGRGEPDAATETPAEAPEMNAQVEAAALAAEAHEPPPTALDADGLPTFDGTPYEQRFRDIKAAKEQKAAKAERPTVRYENGKLVGDSSPPVIEIMSEFDNYRHGKLAVPAFPGDVVYLFATIKTEAGTPLKNVPLKVESKLGNSQVLMADHTDDNGDLEFHLVADRLGEDLITVTAAGVKRDFYLDVSAPRRGEWLGGLDLKGTTSWDLLMSVKLDVQRQQVSARFSPPLQALDGKTVRIAGFMLPLGLDEKQGHFLLSANPPSCFFHPPGGPATAMEVFADKGVPMSYDPMVLEGRLELSGQSADGILYRLRNARLISMVKS
jgi:hypothetical protein